MSLAEKFRPDLERFLTKSPPGTCVDVTADFIRELAQAACEVFRTQPSVLYLEPDVYVIGDTHGQYHDILNYFETFGSPLERNYLFLGDIVDRGLQSIESLVTLLLCKLARPDNFFVIRGNHEFGNCLSSASANSFIQECKDRYPDDGDEIFQALSSTFAYMPICAIIGERILCLHGSLPSNFDLELLERMALPYSQGDGPQPGFSPEEHRILADMVNNILWSDPARPDMDIIYYDCFTVTLDGVAHHVAKNSNRNLGEITPDDMVCQILDKYGFDVLVRAHEANDEGFNMTKSGRIFTIFGATNYFKSLDRRTTATAMYVSANNEIRFLVFNSDLSMT